VSTKIKNEIGPKSSPERQQKERFILVSRPNVIDYYVLVYDPKHPKSVAEGYVPEQILVAEERIGRRLTPDEDVRHINGNTRDNRPSNLEIISLNADYKSQSISNDFAENRTANKTFIPCKFQKPCWKNVRAPLAKKNKVFIPYLCSFQLGGDIYDCSRFWSFLEEEQNKGEDIIDK
jgi:hypothetical protein